MSEKAALSEIVSIDGKNYHKNTGNTAAQVANAINSFFGGDDDYFVEHKAYDKADDTFIHEAFDTSVGTIAGGVIFKALGKGIGALSGTGGRATFNFTKTAGAHMDEVGRMIPVQILDDIIKAPLVTGIDTQGSRALMYYSQMLKNGKLYNVEVLYEKATNTIMHFKYTQKSLGTLPAIK